MGDSFTEGIGDPVDGFAELGAVDRLAAALRQTNPHLRYTNLAKHGLLVGEIRKQQLETALRLKPDLVSVVARADDIMTGRFSATRWEEEFRTFYEATTRAGATVITANLPEFPILRTLREPLRARVKSNIARGMALLNSRGYFKFAQETLTVLEQRTGLKIGDIEAS